MNVFTQIEAIATTIRGMLSIVDSSLDEYADRPLDISASLVSSLCRSLTKALSMTEKLKHLEEIESLNEEIESLGEETTSLEEMGSLEEEIENDPDDNSEPPTEVLPPTAPSAPPSFIITEDILKTYERLSKLIGAISVHLQNNPGKASGSLVDVVTNFSIASVKFRELQVHIEQEKVKAENLEVNGGMTEEEAKMVADFEESMLSDKMNHAYMHPHGEVGGEDTLATEEDYRFCSKPWKDLFDKE